MFDALKIQGRKEGEEAAINFGSSTPINVDLKTPSAREIRHPGKFLVPRKDNWRTTGELARPLLHNRYVAIVFQKRAGVVNLGEF